MISVRARPGPGDTLALDKMRDISSSGRSGPALLLAADEWDSMSL